MEFKGPKGIIGIVLLLLMVGLGIHQQLKVADAQDWPTVQGIVMDSRIDTAKDHKERTPFNQPVSITVGNNQSDKVWVPEYRLTVAYRYQVNGNSYTGHRTNFESSTRSRDSVERKQGAYPPGRTVTVHYNPDNPEEAILLE